MIFRFPINNGYFIRYLFLFIIGLCILGGHKSVQARHVQIIDKNSNVIIGSIPSLKVGRYLFVSLDDWAKTLNIPLYPNEKAKKIVLRVSGHTITVTAYNPFIVVDHQVRQLPINVFYKDGDFLVPIKFFVECINDVFDGSLEYDSARAKLRVFRSTANIVNVSIEDKANGTLIRITTIKEFDQSNIFTSTSQGWLLVDIYGGEVNAGWAPKPLPGSIIRQIEPSQLSEETARLAFKLSSPLKEVRTYPSETPNEILISLRTEENVSQKLLKELERERRKWSINRIIIDPGHGGRDPGTIGKSGLYEKNITLAIAKRLKKLLEKRLSVDVVLIRDEDTAVGLKDRTQMANKNEGKLFISIHADWYQNSRVSGCTTYFLGPAKTEQAREVARLENSVIHYEDSPEEYADLSDANFILAAMAQNLFTKESQDLAAMVQEEMKKRLPIKCRGVKQAGFYVLYGASMPCILHETAFISNHKEEKLLQSSSFQQQVAEGLCESIRKFKAKYEMGM